MLLMKHVKQWTKISGNSMPKPLMVQVSLLWLPADLKILNATINVTEWFVSEWGHLENTCCFAGNYSTIALLNNLLIDKKEHWTLLCSKTSH